MDADSQDELASSDPGSEVSDRSSSSLAETSIGDLAAPRPLVDGELQSKEITGTTVTWTLDLDGTRNFYGCVNSSPFAVDDVSFRLCILSDRLRIYIYVEAADYSGSYILRYSLETLDGDPLQEYRRNADFSENKQKYIYNVSCSEWHRWIDDSLVERLVVTLFPCHLERPNVRTYERPSMGKKCRGVLHQMTLTGVEAVWSVRFPSPGQVMRSELFILGNDSFRLRFGANNTWRFAESVEHLSIQLQRVGGGIRKLLTSFQLTVQGIDQASALSDFVSRLQFRANGSHDCFKMKRKSLLSHLELEKDEHLKIVCSIIQENECTRNVGLSFYGREGFNKVLRDFNELLQTGEDSDLTVEVEGEKFRVHKAVLGIRCPCFADMLQQCMVEKNAGVVKIPDYTAEVFKDFLHYLYTARVESFTLEKALSLYRAAVQYDVQDLKLDSLEFIKRNLSVDILCEVIAFSLKYEEKELLNFVTQVFARNMLSVK